MSSTSCCFLPAARPDEARDESSDSRIAASTSFVLPEQVGSRYDLNSEDGERFLCTRSCEEGREGDSVQLSVSSFSSCCLVSAREENLLTI